MTIPKQILAPTDFSDIAENAVDYAFELAHALGAKVHILHAYSIPMLSEGEMVSANLVDEIVKAAETGLQNSAKKRKHLPELGEVVLQLGDPRDVIVQTANRMHADMVVMGTHGRRGFRRVLLGSVVDSVLRTIQCPVVAVHPPEARDLGA